MKRITFKREENINKDFPYDIYIADKKVAELNNNESKSFDLNFDSEVIFAKIQWCGSRHIKIKQLKDGQIVEVKGNTLLNRRLTILGSLIPLVAIFFTQNKLIENIGIAILGILITFSLATLTIWRNKWIELKIKD